MMNIDLELGGDATNPRLGSDSFVDGSSLENIVDSASVQLIAPSDNSTLVQGVESVGVSVAEGSLDSVSAKGNDSVVNNRRADDLNQLGVLESHDKELFSDRNHGSVKQVKGEQQKGQRRKESKSKESASPVYDSMLSMFDDFAANGSVATVNRPSKKALPDHGFEVGDMVWGKVKSHPWWPGHVYSEEFATPSVRRSKRNGLLLVAFFGDSSYGWFDPSELIPFDSNYAEKSRQTNSKTFVKAVEEAMDEVSRRSALGLSCMCRSKKNFRKTDVQGFFAVDVPDYEPGAVYSVDAIEKARKNFQPSLALDFVRQLALEPTGSELAGIDFIKNKANVISYRKAVYEEFDETYAQAFGQSVQPPSGALQELPPGRTSFKAPLSGRQVFADTSGKGKSPAKPSKSKDHAKKDKYLFKRRDESKHVKVHQKEKAEVAIEDSVAIAAGDYVLQKRVSNEQVGPAIADDELASKDPTNGTAVADDEVGAPGFQTIPNKVELPITTSVDDEKKIVPQMEDKKTDDKSLNVPNSEPHHKPVASENGQKKVKVAKRPVGEMGSEKKKKRRKEASMPDGTNIIKKEGKVSAKTPVQSSLATKASIDSKPTTSTSGEKEMSGPVSYGAELQRALADLHSLALDPFHAIKRGQTAKARQVFLKFRSRVFQKSLNLTGDDTNDTTQSQNALISSQNGPTKPHGRPDDPTIGGRKRGPSDRQEEMAAKKKKKVVDVRNLTKEKKVVKKPDEPAPRDVKQPVVKTPGPELVKKTEQRAAEPTMLLIKFPLGGSMPSINELKARFARYGPMDHSGTRIFWNTSTCRVVYRHKIHAQAAYNFVIASGSLFGNTDVKCCLKEVGFAEPEPPVNKLVKEETSTGKVVKEETSSTGVRLKSILKKSGSEEAAVNGGRAMARVKFMLGVDESKTTSTKKKMNGSTFSSSSTTTSNATMDINSKSFQKAVLPLPPISTSITSSTSTTQFTRPPPPHTAHYGSEMVAPPPLPPRPPPGNFVHNLQRPNMGMGGGGVDISEQMISLLRKCNEIVSNVSNMLGYMPYHPL